MARVAVLGTGRMGSAMARALVRAGHVVVLWNRTPAAAEALVAELGPDAAAAATSPGDAVASADVAITMLADGAAVLEVFRSAGGLLEGVHDGLVVLEMSTVEPSVSQVLAPEVAARGGALLDAPVSGSTDTAASGQLTVMVGGDADAFGRVRPVLDVLAARIFHLGPVGSGAAMKLAVNTVVFGLDVALSEALVLAERAGVGREQAYDVFQASAVGAPLVGYKRANFMTPETAATQFSLDLAAKDLGLISSLAASAGVPMAQADTNLAVIRAAAASQGGGRDFALVAAHLRDHSST